VQEKETAEGSADPDAGRLRRKCGPLAAAQNDAALSAVPRRIDDFKADPRRDLAAQRHVPEIVDSLIGPAALAVVLAFVGESPIHMRREVERNQRRGIDLPGAAAGGFQRQYFAVPFAGEGIFEHIAQVSRRNTVSINEFDRIQLSPENAPFAESRFDDCIVDSDAADHVTARGDRVAEKRPQRNPDGIAVVGILPGIEIERSQPIEYRVFRMDQIDQCIRGRFRRSPCQQGAGILALFENDQEPARFFNPFKHRLAVDFELAGILLRGRNHRHTEFRRNRIGVDHVVPDTVTLQQRARPFNVFFAADVQQGDHGSGGGRNRDVKPGGITDENRIEIAAYAFSVRRQLNPQLNVADRLGRERKLYRN